MAPKAKTGKQRKDKYYRLAKETGFRSRAAFKLLQLNRKYGFLEKSRVLVDLCAAPGGWMQVAQQNMPVSSVVVGVDLHPIKPILGCISLTEDITTDKCRVELKKALQNWKADVVLNDGAPNVGANWLLDAYQQISLALSALKLATELLRPGGWFVTKIFRSRDYDSFMWVLQQLFKKVHATKPQASRNESAEIFVVCQGYKAPDKLDPKFLDPKYVFKEIDMTVANTLNLFHPEKIKKKRAVGYEEGDYLQHQTIPVSEYLDSADGINILQKASEIVFDDDDVLNHPKTTEEIKECCKDIKLLNRKDLRLLLSWWKIMKKFVSERNKKLNIEDEKENEIKKEKQDDIEMEEEELDEVAKHIKELEEEETKEQKRKKRLAEKARLKLQEKMDLKMVLESDKGPVVEEEAMFRLSSITSKKDLNKVTEEVPDTLAESEPESDDDLPKPKKVKFMDGENRLASSGKYYKDEESESEEEEKDSDDDDDDDVENGLGLSASEDDEDDAEIDESNDLQNDNPLLTDLDFRRRKEKRLSKVAMWFSKDNLKNLETEADEDYDLDVLSEELKKKGGRILGEDDKEEKEGILSKKAKKEKNAHVNGKRKDEKSDSDSDSDSDSSSDDSEYNVEKERFKKQKKSGEKNGFEVVPKGKVKKRKLNEEGLAMGTLMVSSKKTKRDLIDGGWNRYAFNDEDIPDWFAKDEKKHNTAEIPVPTELVSEYKNKLKEINARPMKKVIEAKARKKKRMLRRMEKAKKKMEVLMDNPDASNLEKIREIKKLYKRAEGRKKEVSYVVAKKHTATKRLRRPLGIKGPYKVVDSRMKKDKLKTKRMEKKAKGQRSRRKKRN